MPYKIDIWEWIQSFIIIDGKEIEMKVIRNFNDQENTVEVKLAAGSCSHLGGCRIIKSV